MRVLIVDDCPIEIALLRRILARLGHEVVAAAATPSEGVELAHEMTPDLACVDGRIAADGCVRLVTVLREAVPGMNVAIIASLDEIGLVRAGIAAGASGAVRRPIVARQCAESLENLVSSSV